MGKIRSIAKKQLPKEIEVFGVSYLIDERVIKENEDFRGDCCESKKIITIDINMSLHDKKQTLLHECFHAVWSETGLAETKIPLEVEEVIVENISRFMIKRFNISFKK